MTEAEKIHQIWAILRPFTREMREQLTLRNSLAQTHWTELSREHITQALLDQIRHFFDELDKPNNHDGVQRRAVDVACMLLLIVDAYKGWEVS